MCVVACMLVCVCDCGCGVGVIPFVLLCSFCFERACVCLMWLRRFVLLLVVWCVWCCDVYCGVCCGVV